MHTQIEDFTFDDLQTIDGRTPQGFCRLIFTDELRQIVNVPPATRIRWEGTGRFPKPILLGHKRGPNRKAWLGTEVEEWLRNKIEERDAA